jgi:hypothetical protein
MRASLSVLSVVAVTVIMLLVLCDSASSASSYQNTRNKPRTIRGFKNVALSTARGFGKRDGALTYLADNANTAAEPSPERYGKLFRFRTNTETMNISGIW